VAWSLQAYLERERGISRDIAASTGPVRLLFERVVLADSGTLLLTWSNPCGKVWRMRQACREAFPGALPCPVQLQKQRQHDFKHDNGLLCGKFRHWAALLLCRLGREDLA
jgi:hypothetical protein